MSESGSELSSPNTLENPNQLPKATLEYFDGDELAARCFIEKYAARDDDGALIETEPRQMWNRVAEAISSVEPPDRREAFKQQFYDLLTDFRFIPGGRILFGAGSRKRVTLTNCYFTSIEEDSIEGIFDWCKKAARTYSYGGGNGVDVGVLRPKGAPVNNSAGSSTGPVSFMEIMSQTTGTIGQAGRRGALMITMPVTHPNIAEFVEVKKGNTDSVRYANISVKLTDDFMRAVVEGNDYKHSYTDHKGRTTEGTSYAPELWDRIISSAHQSAEPGLLFWDTVKRESPSEYCAPVAGTNPCGEQPLEHNGACTLGHMNLSQYVTNPFKGDANIDWVRLGDDISTAVRFLDNVVEYNLPLHAHKAQAAQARNTRRIGLGVTALADTLIMLGVKYDTEVAIELVERLMSFIRNAAYLSSSRLAREKGTFPLFNAARHLQRPFVQRLPNEVQDAITINGLRNICILTVAPVGSGSTLTQTSSGIEPIFALSYKRRSESLTQEWFDVAHKLVEKYVVASPTPYPSDLRQRLAALPPTFVVSHQIDPFFRVRMQGVIQQYIDSAISSTVNLPRDVSVDTVKQIYLEAWRQGCKGMTVYREGSREGILITEHHSKPPEKQLPTVRPVSVEGRTHRVSTPNGSMFVTVNHIGDTPYEVFCSIGKSGGHTASFTEALGRMVSIGLQHGVPLESIVEQLDGIRGPEQVLAPGGAITSVPDALARVLGGYLEVDRVDNIRNVRDLSSECSECGGQIVRENGCSSCTNCSRSRCG